MKNGIMSSRLIYRFYFKINPMSSENPFSMPGICASPLLCQPGVLVVHYKIHEVPVYCRRIESQNVKNWFEAGNR